MADSLYTLEKLTDAVHALATGPGRIQERLVSAASRGLLQADPESLPDQLRGRFRELMDELTRHDGPDGRFKASVDAMSEDRAVEIARAIQDIRDEFDSLLAAQQ